MLLKLKNLVTASFNTIYVLFTTEKFMKSRETALKEMIPRNIIQASLSSRNIILALFKLI